MALLDWAAELALGVPEMDETHREFVDRLNALDAAADGAFLVRLDEFIAHTAAHFAQETRWMRDVRFPPIQCHEAEHDNVMEVMRDVRDRVAAGDLRIGRLLVAELPAWLRGHIATMDAALAHYMRTLKYRASREPVAA